MAKWQLVKCENIEWKQDKSGYYTLVNYVGNGLVRLDIMSVNSNPLISFEGTAEAVRKNAMRYLDKNCINLSLEHAAYIGYELAMCDMLRDEYKQD